MSQLAHDEGECTPMLLHHGHGFCRACLTFEILKKNFHVLSLIHDGHDFSDEEDPSLEKAVEVGGRWNFEKETAM
ncbi:hypothetical protein AMTRI_Chr10g2090 [Amborella trichopoda]